MAKFGDIMGKCYCMLNTTDIQKVIQFKTKEKHDNMTM